VPGPGVAAQADEVKTRKKGRRNDLPAFGVRGSAAPDWPGAGNSNIIRADAYFAGAAFSVSGFTRFSVISFPLWV